MNRRAKTKKKHMNIENRVAAASGEEDGGYRLPAGK